MIKREKFVASEDRPDLEEDRTDDRLNSGSVPLRRAISRKNSLNSEVNNYGSLPRHINHSNPLSKAKSTSSVTSSRKIFNWAGNKQRSFTNYLTLNRRNSESSEDSKDILPTVDQDKTNRNIPKLQRTFSVPVVENKLVTLNQTCPEGVLKNSRTDCFRKTKKTVTFPDECVQELKDASKQNNTFTSIETIDVNNLNDNFRCISSSDSQFKENKTFLDDINLQKSSQPHKPRPYRRSQSVLVPELLSNKTLLPSNNLTKELSSRCSAINCNFDRADSSVDRANKDVPNNSIQITRIGGVRVVSNQGKDNTPISNPLPKLPDKKLPSANSLSVELLVHKEKVYQDNITSSGTEDSELNPTQIKDKCTENYPLVQSGIKSVESSHGSVTESDQKETAESLPSDIIQVQELSTSESKKTATIIRNPFSTSEDSVKLPKKKLDNKLSKRDSIVGISTLRFLSRGINLPPIASKSANKAAREAEEAKAAFFSELPYTLRPDLANLLYARMKGVHDGLLVTACKLVEEDQVLRLIKDLSANGHLEQIINQKDKTGRVSQGEE